jgi:cardiolipin synthase (CMP-forming)
LLKLHFQARAFLRPPMLMSLLRVPLALLFPFVVHRPFWGLWVLAMAALSDVLDGYLARHLGQSTPEGAVIDGLVDKFFALVIALSLWSAGLLAFWQLFLLGLRDWLRFYVIARAYAKDVVAPPDALKANQLGKWTTILQFLAFSVALMEWPGLSALSIAAALLGTLAAWSYLRRFSPHAAPPADETKPQP